MEVPRACVEVPVAQSHTQSSCRRPSEGTEIGDGGRQKRGGFVRNLDPAIDDESHDDDTHSEKQRHAGDDSHPLFDAITLGEGHGDGRLPEAEQTDSDPEHGTGMEVVAHSHAQRDGDQDAAGD